MSQEDAVTEVARRFAAAYVSYMAGYAGVDRVLGRVPKVPGRFWRELARLIIAGMAGSKEPKLQDVITKYIQ